MASRPSRYRSSTSASTPQPTSKAVEVLQKLLDGVTTVLSSSAHSGYPNIDELARNAFQIKQHLAAIPPPSSVQDDFRHLHGFHRMFEVLRSYSGFYNPSKRSEEEKRGLFALLDAVLGVLSSAFRAHPGNRRYFRIRVERGGWEALEQSIASIGLGGSDLDFWTSGQLFGKLLAFALNDPALDQLCSTATLHKIDVQLDDVSSSYEVLPRELSREDGDGKTADPVVQIDKSVHEVINAKSTLRNPEMIRTIVDFWVSMPRGKDTHNGLISVLVLKVLEAIIDVSEYNLSLVHESGVISRFMQLAFDEDSFLDDIESSIVMDICKKLMYLGVGKLADAQALLTNPSSSSANFCLDMVQKHQSPPFIQFDLSLHGHSSIDVPSLGRTFPPQSTAGYTFTAWIRVDKFDPNSHTTIFGVFDATQTCFLLIYLEKDSRNFILQTSVRSQRPSVRFKSFTFEEGQWYHIALVHRRPKTMTPSKASLYVNGEFVEQIKAVYPSSPPPTNASTESFASFTSSSSRTHPVLAFIGTPKELATYLGHGLVHTKMSLASTHLFEEALSDELLAVSSRLGPRYQGNFQDCLGGFQTYEASAALGLRNDMVITGKDGNSDILRVIRDKAGLVLPEHRILLSMMPSSIFREKDPLGDSQLFRSLSRGPANTLIQMTLKNGIGVAINTAQPSVNDALIRSNGVAVLTGEPIIAVPQYLDDTMWRLAGFTPLALKLIERAATSESLLQAVELVFRCANSSWRNSEALEREGGYAIIGILLKIKLGLGTIPSGNDRITERLLIDSIERDKLCFQLLSLLLEFVGYRHTDPLDSVIINPLAYRILLIDFDGWRKCAPIIQELYYKQFVTFAVMSKHHQYNNRRLLRMRIVKRLLDALKAEPLPRMVLPFFMTALENLVKCSYNTDVHRSIALFITYAFHAPSASSSKTPKSGSASLKLGTQQTSRRSTPSIDNTKGRGAFPLLKREIGIKILEMYSQLLCERGNLMIIRKFARTVTNKVLDERLPTSHSRLTMAQWLLHLLSEDSPEIVIHGCKILARLLVAHGTSYTSKFSGKTGGFFIMAHRLKRWWDIPTIWPICLSILFGYDVAEIDFEKNFDFFSLIETFGRSKVVHPEALPIITSMLQHGLKDVLNNQEDPDSPSRDRSPSAPSDVGDLHTITRPRARSMSLLQELETRPSQSGRDRVASNAAALQTVLRFLSDLHARSADFREFALSSDYVRLLLSGLYPVLVSTDAVTPETELNSRDSALTFDGGDVIIRPMPGSSAPAPIVRTSKVNDTTTQGPISKVRGTALRKASSFILLTSQKSPPPNPTRLAHVMSPKKKVASQSIGNTVLEAMMELVVNVFIDQLLARKEFPGFGLFLKVPPGFQEHQAYFESFVLQRTINHLSTALKLDWKLLQEPKVLTNMARFSLHMVEAIFEGWFMNGTESMLDFAGLLLEHLQKPEIARLKTIRLCNQAVSTIRGSFLKLILLRLSEMDDPQTIDLEANFSMNKLLYWQMVVLDSLSVDDDYMKLLWYQLYIKLVDDSREGVRLAVVNIWRIMLVQKPEECSILFRHLIIPDHGKLTMEFQKLTELDNDTFIAWVDEHRPSLDGAFLNGLSRTWEDFVAFENQKTLDTARSRLSKRRETLKRWQVEMLEREKVILHHDMANHAWMKSIYGSEHYKHQRSMQDQQDDIIYFSSSFGKMQQDLTRPGAIFYESRPTKWKLDRTEGRNRMRIRILPDSSTEHDAYQPKRRNTDLQSASSLRLNTAITEEIGSSSAANTPLSALPKTPIVNGFEDAAIDLPLETSEQQPNVQDSQSVMPDDEFELVDDPNDPDGQDGFEDKNRRVMRRLESHDAVQQVYNVSRIIGLEACEGILLLGKDHLYLMDNFFHCADGEIVNAWEAPEEERDPFSQIVMGRNTRTTANKPSMQSRRSQNSRNWSWQDVISISKRRFLLRDVAIEIFFTDGRSYLLTTINSTVRDEVYNRLINKVPHTASGNTLPSPEDTWRLESLKVFDENPQGLGSKFGSLFNASPWNPVMRRWQRGEISNFHYLMLVNTMAGRTFNDLTQYPVFPWILADYTSEELDLNNPATFRDLSKPMGAQTPGRQSDYALRYQSLAEIGEQPFHYGTHYSSSMVVASYLIRLPPFVQSYILLQGGSFDHADRLFYSIEGSWNSASRDNGADVRELIPEFFYLPEFLVNMNGYDFGERQGSGGKVNHVKLPPWAKGDPKIFIAKHREALESPYVSQHLHSWIDLVFGCKQRGEAAVENMNVFHWLSYHGAKNLDNITNAHERESTTSIIHNFGQTPFQVFTRPHPSRENVRFPAKRLDTSCTALARIPHPLLDSHERVSSLIYSTKSDRLLCSSPFRLNLPPSYDKYLEWGYADNSIRFYFTENRKNAGINENLHIGQISCIIVADSKTIITAGEDCVVSVYNIQTAAGKPVELQLRSSLFGHKTPVTTIAVSKAFSTFVTVSTDGHAFLWDLNRLEFIRKLPRSPRAVECAKINDVSGEIMLCSGPNVTLYTLNGELILDQNTCVPGEHDDFIHSCAFYEGSGSEWLEDFVLFTGHKRGRVNIWRRAVGKNGKWLLELVRRLDHIDTRSETGANVEAAITCICPMPQIVYTGDDDGRVYEWNLIQRER